MGIISNILSGGKESFTKSKEELANDAVKMRNKHLDTLNKLAGERYSKEIPSYIDKAIGGIANLESYSGVKRQGDIGLANSAHGLLHIRQPYIDEVRRLSPHLGIEVPNDLKAQELEGANRDNLSKLYAGKMINKYMKDHNVDVYTAARMTHNKLDPNYGKNVKERIVRPVIVNPTPQDTLIANPQVVSVVPK